MGRGLTRPKETVLDPVPPPAGWGGGENLLTLHHTLSSHLHNEGIRLKFPSELHCSVTLSHRATANSAN